MKNIEKTGDKKTKFPSLLEIIEINEKVRKRYVPFDLDGGRNLIYPDLLEHVLNAIRFPVFGIHLHPDIFSKAAYLAYTIIKRHLFFTFNEETGLLVAKLLLKKNGFEFILPHNYNQKIMAIIEGRMDVNDFRIWLRENCVKIEK